MDTRHLRSAWIAAGLTVALLAWGPNAAWANAPDNKNSDSAAQKTPDHATAGTTDKAADKTQDKSADRAKQEKIDKAREQVKKLAEESRAAAQKFHQALANLRELQGESYWTTRHEHGMHGHTGYRAWTRWHGHNPYAASRFAWGGRAHGGPTAGLWTSHRADSEANHEIAELRKQVERLTQTVDELQKKAK